MQFVLQHTTYMASSKVVATIINSIPIPPAKFLFCLIEVTYCSLSVSVSIVNRWWEGVQIGRTEGMVYGVVCIHLVYCVYLQVVCLCVKNPPWFIAGFCRWSSGVDMTNLSVVEPCGRCWSSSLLMQKTFSRCFVRDIYMPHLIWVSAVNSATQKKKREKESKCRINMVILTLEADRGTCMVNIGSVRRLWSCI